MTQRPGFGAGLAAALLAVVIWGVQFPVAKDAFAQIDPFHITAIRYLVGTLALLPLVLWREGLQVLRYEGRFASATLHGLIGMCGSPMLVFWGLAHTRPEHTAIIVSTQPVLTALAEWLVRGRRPTRATLLCLLAAVLGAITVITKWDLALVLSPGELKGDLLALGGAICWVSYALSAERYPAWSSVKFTTLTLIPGTIATLCIVAWSDFNGWLVLPSMLQLQAAGPELVYLSFIGVLVAMLAWNAGLARIGALNAMLLLCLFPVITFAVRYAQGQRFTALELAGAALVVGALAVNNLYQRRLASQARADFSEEVKK